MSTVKGAIVSPLIVLAAAVVAFAVWIVFYTTPPTVTVPGAHVVARRFLPPPPPGEPDSIETRLAALKPGAPRLAVEQQFQALAEPEVEPIDVAHGQPTFRSRYRVNLARPVPSLAVGPAEFVPGAYILTVEFDGGTPSHPLTRAALAPAPVR